MPRFMTLLPVHLDDLTIGKLSSPIADTHSVRMDESHRSN